MMKKGVDFAKLTFLCSSALVVFAYGVAVGAYEIFPFAAIKFGVHSVQEVWRTRFGTRPAAYLERARFDGSGVTLVVQDKVAPGLTLLTGFFTDGNELRLIRQDGTFVNRWPVRFSELFPDPSHIEPSSEIPDTDWNTDINGALALPDGSVVFSFEYKGMVKLDRCGVVQWTVPRMTHHSISLGGDGSFWVGGRRYHAEGIPEFRPFRGPYFEDTILRISEDGRVLEELSVPDLLFKNGLASLLLANDSWISTVGRSEIVHLNDIEELPDDLADGFLQFTAGDLLLSLRNLNSIMVVDPRTQAVKWHQVGPWIRQHDPDFRNDGTISVFNNNSDGTRLGRIFGGSTILELDPASGTVRVLYGGTPEQHMHTDIRGKHENLADGNILITESLAGRVFEVTDRGELVWEFINRFDGDEVARLSDAIRYPEEYFVVEDWECE